MASTLVIDAGNSSTTIALFHTEGARIEAVTAVRGGISAARGECAIAIRKVFAAADIAKEPVTKAMMASVTPSVNGAWERLVQEEAGLDLEFVRYDIRLPFTLDYEHPECTGADRLADMTAAAVLYGAPALVIDIGTAVTYDLLSENHRFFTGVIGPGPEILARSLHDYTALLPSVEWWKKEAPIEPKNTEQAMLFGIDAGFTGVIRETVMRLQPLVGNNAHRVITGGFAQRFVDKLGMDFIVDRDLTLRGIGILSVGDF